MTSNSYLVLLADRKSAKMVLLKNGYVMKTEEFHDGHVPQKVRHGDDTWDAQDKIFRHIEDHLHRHLAVVGHHAAEFAHGEKITGVVIGSHRALFGKIEKHLPYPLSKKVKGRFVTELKAPFNAILERAVKRIEQLEKEET